MIFIFYQSISSQEAILEIEHKKKIEMLIDAFKRNDKVSISKLIYYPLRRNYPIPLVKNETELIARFDMIFDKTLKNKIIHSSIEKDWENIWQQGSGIMFQNGSLWMDYGGRVYTINYESAVEKKMREKLIKEEKKILHPSVRFFEWNSSFLETENFRIRIDYSEKYKYRYASWSKEKKQSEKPDLIIENGFEEQMGSGDIDLYYRFMNGTYEYVINKGHGLTEINFSGKLYIYKDKKKIKEEKIVNFINE